VGFLLRRFCRRRDQVGDRAPPTFVPSSTPSFTSWGQAASGDCCHANFQPCGTVYHYFQARQNSGVWVHLQSSALFPRIRTVIADAGDESRKLARTLKQHQGWQLRIVKRRQRAFKITGLTWIVERSFAWLGRNRRLSKDYEYRVQTSETMIDLAAIRLMLNRIAPA
jgi:transposase